MRDYLTYYIRHKMDVDAVTLGRLWKRNKIAIHFPWTGRKKDFSRPDSSNTNPSAYRRQGAKQALTTLKELAENGGYVCAEYEGKRECILGFVPSDSKIRIFLGKWKESERRKDRVAKLKCLTLRKAKKRLTASLAQICVGRPQRGTIRRWPSAKDAVRYIVRNKRPATSEFFDSLFPYQQEVMCEEFLRSRAAKESGLPMMARLLLPVGGAMKDIDIYGVGVDGKKIIAQVTHYGLKETKSSKKFERLRAWGDAKSDHLIFFCNECERTEQDGVLVVPLREVYAEFVRTDAGRLWLKDVMATYC